MIKDASITTMSNAKPGKSWLNLVRGIPGSGKTTWAKGVSAIRSGSVVVSADMYFCKETGNYDFDGEQLHRAHRWCFDTVKAMLQDGVEVYVTNTFVKYNQISDYFKFAVDNGFGITLISMNNDFGSVHNVPDESMVRFRNSYQSHDQIVTIFNENFKYESNR